MPTYTDFLPVFVRTEDDIRADWDVIANAGVTPGDSEWVDTRQGSVYFLGTQPAVREFAKAYDRLNEAVAAGILATSWGPWLDLHAASYGEERIAAVQATGEATFSGQDGTIIGTGARVSPEQTDPDVEPPIFETTAGGVITGGSVTLPVIARDAGEVGNVPPGAISMLLTGVGGVTAVTNELAIGGGAEAESDSALKRRLVTIFQGGRANIAAYAREALKWPGVGYVRVEPHWDGPGTVRLSILDENRNALPDAVAEALQTYMDPDPGRGKGWAPINHVVTVIAPTATTLYVVATPAFAAGYSLDGASGTIALRNAITAAVQDYADSLMPGDDVVYDAVKAQFFKVEGLVGVSDLAIGTDPDPIGTTDVVVAADNIITAGPVTLS
jgi:uncharacterized phage protein gp47/JayE